MKNNKTCFTYVDQLDEKTIDLLDQIIVGKTEDVENGFIGSWMNKNSKESYVMLKNSKSDTTKKVTDIACTFFKNAGISVNEDYGDISYVSYDYNSAIYASWDNWIDNIYCANDGYESVDVHECIIVTKKGENLKDGNMEVYKKNPYTFLNLIGYEKEDKDVYELEAGTVLVFNGDTIHKLQSFKGNGTFNYIIVTMYDSMCDVK